MVRPWQRIQARVQRWGFDTLLMSRAWRRNGEVEMRLLRLTDPSPRAPVLGRGRLTAGPGDLRRHRAAQLVHHRVHDHALRIRRRKSS